VKNGLSSVTGKKRKEVSDKSSDKTKKKPKMNELDKDSSKNKAKSEYDVTKDPRWQSSAFRSIFMNKKQPKYSKPSQISTKMPSAMSQL